MTLNAPDMIARTLTFFERYRTGTADDGAKHPKLTQCLYVFRRASGAHLTR